MEDETKNEPTQQQEQAPEPQAKTYSEEDYNALQAKLDAVTGQLNDANSKIQSYTEMDIDGIKQSAADWQKKYEAAQADGVQCQAGQVCGAAGLPESDLCGLFEISIYSLHTEGDSTCVTLPSGLTVFQSTPSA